MKYKTFPKFAPIMAAVGVIIFCFVFYSRYETTEVTTSFCEALLGGGPITMTGMHAEETETVDANGYIVHPKGLSFYKDVRTRIIGHIGNLEDIDIKTQNQTEDGATTVFVVLNGSSGHYEKIVVSMVKDHKQWKIVDVNFPDAD